MQYDGDLLDQLTADHRAVLVRFGEPSGLPDGDPRRKAPADPVTDRLVRHTRAEEVRPPMRVRPSRTAPARSPQQCTGRRPTP
ncbi:hypothetical protein ACFV1W_38850 [Kitasatospora sp. NPDC059648]|uniref:hypothetical protein n=1 Tax=Kitasatospora sp. NPDC059648 TaxID=3346894 RepID=UPI0036B72D05